MQIQMKSNKKMKTKRQFENCVARKFENEQGNIKKDRK